MINAPKGIVVRLNLMQQAEFLPNKMLGNFVFLSGILALFLCIWSYWRDFQYEKQHWGTCKSKDSRDRTPPQRSLQYPLHAWL